MRKALRIDMHVHIAELGRHAATDAFVTGRPNMYVRMFLRGLGLRGLSGPGANDAVRQALFGWVDRSSIDRFVLLAMDGVYRPDGTPDVGRSAFVVDNDFVAEIAASHPKLRFGASVHPYRRDAIVALEAAIARGACLVKWIPSTHNIRVDDPRVTAFYDVLAARGVPLLVHTGNEHASSKALNSYNDPALLKLPLDRGVTVIAAHCGARMYLHERCYFKTFCRMAREYSRLYGDISAFGLPTRIPMIRTLQKHPELMAKVVYGSDFPAGVMPWWFVLSIGLAGVRKVLAEANPLERSYVLMRAMGVPDEVFTRAATLLPGRARTTLETVHAS